MHIGRQPTFQAMCRSSFCRTWSVLPMATNPETSFKDVIWRDPIQGARLTRPLFGGWDLMNPPPPKSLTKLEKQTLNFKNRKSATGKITVIVEWSFLGHHFRMAILRMSFGKSFQNGHFGDVVLGDVILIDLKMTGQFMLPNLFFKECFLFNYFNSFFSI